MRTPFPFLPAAAAGSLLVLALSTGTALAAPSPGGVAEPGAVQVSPASAAPGSSVRISGTCPTAADGAGDPVLQSVTSDAFTAPESFSKTDPTAFDGTATIARGASAGAHDVLLTCSNGTASTTVTVTGGSTAGPTPSGGGTSGTTPAGGSGAGTSGAGTGGGTAPEPTAAAGADAEAGSGSRATVVDEETGSSTPWGWITAGGLVVVGAAAGTTYLLTRRRDASSGPPSSHTGE
ncbi:hypothetical protein [Blastococcus sp. SYSU D01042]